MYKWKEAVQQYAEIQHKGDALSPLLFNFALPHAIWKVQEHQVKLKLNGIHQLLVM
jgi:uncharacterized protein YfbU (UPF0304 family)